MSWSVFTAARDTVMLGLKYTGAMYDFLLLFYFIIIFCK